MELKFPSLQPFRAYVDTPADCKAGHIILRGQRGLCYREVVTIEDDIEARRTRLENRYICPMCALERTDLIKEEP